MFAEGIPVGCVMLLACVPNVLGMIVAVWVLLNSKVSIATEEVPVKRAALAFRLTLVNVLGLDHGLFCEVVLGLSNHSCEGLKIGSGVPCVTTALTTVRHVLGKAEA